MRKMEAVCRHFPFKKQQPWMEEQSQDKAEGVGDVENEYSILTFLALSPLPLSLALAGTNRKPETPETLLIWATEVKWKDWRWVWRDREKILAWKREGVGLGRLHK